MERAWIKVARALQNISSKTVKDGSRAFARGNHRVLYITSIECRYLIPWETGPPQTDVLRDLREFLLLRENFFFLLESLVHKILFFFLAGSVHKNVYFHATFIESDNIYLKCFPMGKDLIARETLMKKVWQSDFTSFERRRG